MAEPDFQTLSNMLNWTLRVIRFLQYEEKLSERDRMTLILKLTDFFDVAYAIIDEG